LSPQIADIFGAKRLGPDRPRLPHATDD
jgi:hypothetical protein